MVITPKLLPVTGKFINSVGEEYQVGQRNAERERGLQYPFLFDIKASGKNIKWEKNQEWMGKEVVGNYRHS